MGRAQINALWADDIAKLCPEKLTEEQGLSYLQSNLKKFRTGSRNPEFDYNYEGKIENFRFTEKVMVSDPDERECFQSQFKSPCNNIISIRGFLNRCIGIEYIVPFNVGCKLQLLELIK